MSKAGEAWFPKRGPCAEPAQSRASITQDCQAATKDFRMLPCCHLLATASLTATPPSATRGVAPPPTPPHLVLPIIFRLGKTLRKPVIQQGGVTDVHTVGNSRHHRQLMAKLPALEPELTHLFLLGGMLKDTKVTFLCLALPTSRRNFQKPTRDRNGGRQWIRELSQGTG